MEEVQMDTEVCLKRPVLRRMPTVHNFDPQPPVLPLNVHALTISQADSF